jgi:two-component system CheB/CheR fusion protein
MRKTKSLVSASKRRPAGDGLDHPTRTRSADLEAQRLRQELEIHQIELEMQNEELRTARAQTEAALESYTKLFDFAPIGYVVLDVAGKVKQLNFSAAELLGVVRSRAVGKRFVTFVSLRDQQEFLKLMAKLTRSDTAREQQELTLKRTAPIQVLLTATLQPSNEPTLLVALQDITARKRAEADLLEAQQRKDEFLAMLSHELRNPLMPIRTSLTLANGGQANPELIAKALTIIDRQASHLYRIVDDLLDINRITHGKIGLKLEPLDVTEQIRQTIGDHGPDFGAKGIALKCRLGGRELWIQADPTRVSQIIGNLLINACKFTPAGGRVVASLREVGDGFAEFELRDTGPGMTRAEIEHAFEPFSQSPQAQDRPKGGLGLGLALVKRLAEMHGGAVEIRSPGPGLGSTVIVRLPLTKLRAESTQAQPCSTRNSHRVLIIEDYIDSANLLAEVLNLDGHQVRVAYDGFSGVTLARQWRPEVVLCDIGLPAMDGYEVARSFRRDNVLKDIPLVALTGYASLDEERRATAAGFDRHLAKPISYENLTTAISSVMSRTRSDQKLRVSSH